MASVKILKPPFKWAGKSLEEDHTFKPWTREQLRTMKHGTYDWSKHEERRA